VGTRQEQTANAGTRYGVAFHRVMDALTSGRAADEALRRGLALPEAVFGSLVSQARGLLARRELERYFDPRRYRRAANEVPYADATGAVRRIDRLVEFEDEVWVLDYKSGGSAVAGTLGAEYRRQVREYCAAASLLFPDKRVHGLLVFTDGACVKVEGDA
jgi:ATP-dependent helicase/nuclease subunit A